MKLDSSNPPVFLPQSDQQSVLRLGFENCPLEDWICPAHDLAVFNRHKLATQRSLGDRCFSETPGSAQAQREFHDFLLQHLLQHPALGYCKSGNRLVHEGEGLGWELTQGQLWSASNWIAEDICLLEERGDGYRLSAASVCSPSNWFLEEKIGQSVDFIHAPVPGYDSVLSERVNRFLQGLRCARVMLRYNWSMQADNELCWRARRSPPLRPLANANGDSYWRVERQTFLRLPVSRAIVFGIRIFLHSFDSLGATAGFDESIRKLLEQLPETEKRYKNLS